MRLLRLIAPLTIACLCLAAQPSLAQSLESLAKERKTINSTLSQHKERADYLRERILRAKEDVADADAALESQEEKLSQAITKAEQDPGNSTARAATHASIRYNRTEAKTERMQDRLDSAQTELASIQAHEIELNKRLAEIAIAEQKIAADQRKPKPAVVASPTIIVEKPSAVVAPTVAQEAPTLATSTSEPSTTTATWPTATDETAADIAFAKNTVAALKSKPVDSAPLSNVKLNHNRGRSTEGLDYMGGNLYSVTLKLQAGMWGFKIFNDTFWVSIPKEKAEQDFLILYDVNSKATLHVFRASLIN